MKDVNGADVKGCLMSFIKEKRLSKSEFERRCGLSNGYLNSTRGNFGTRKLEGTFLSSSAQINKLIDINAEQSHSLVRIADKLADRL